MRCPSVLSYLTLALCVLQVREERLAEEKIKKRAAARKMEEAEARRRQEEEARRQRALQQVCVWACCVPQAELDRGSTCLGHWEFTPEVQRWGFGSSEGFLVNNSCLGFQEEEEERRRRELMQKKREEEQERARKIAEQRQAEQERERQLAAEREMERKREQERIQAEK